MKDKFAKNLMELNGRIAEACENCDRDTDDIAIVAVTKTFPSHIINIAVAAGIHNIGENRIQEAETKINEVGQIARFHLIGHLQTNKVKKAVALFDMIQSIDTLKLAEEINRRAADINRRIECLIEVNSSGEDSKFGVTPNETMELIKSVNDLPQIDLVGLMTIGPLTNDEGKIRDAFNRVHDLYHQGEELIGRSFDTLSMGMSGDFPLAIECGSTMIRVGSGLFGSRNVL